MRHRIYVHVTWTTRGRELLIDDRIARFLRRFLCTVAQQERARVIEIGIVKSHLHLFLRLHPSTSIPRLLQRFKGGSATLANREGHAEHCERKWAKGALGKARSE
ncbi:MAG: transposase [Gemmatimonadetes bacterium]|nr:transposase [Gemmatimonadota bacterium]